jgi:acyl carrier protein
MENEVKGKIMDFIVANYLFGDATRKPQENESLITTGIVDSTGVLELIEFLESSFGIQVKDTETIPQNLDSIENLTRFVMGKKA